MNKIEALRKEADLREMVEGTDVKWWECVQTKHIEDSYWHTKGCSSSLDVYPEDYWNIRYALAIVENKPVFVGDELWHKKEGFSLSASKGTISKVNATSYSWSPPKPRTVMVELLVKDAEWYVANTVINHRLGEACRKALEQLNGGGK